MLSATNALAWWRRPVSWKFAMNLASKTRDYPTTKRHRSQQWDIETLPDDVLRFPLASRYCDTELGMVDVRQHSGRLATGASCLSLRSRVHPIWVSSCEGRPHSFRRPCRTDWSMPRFRTSRRDTLQPMMRWPPAGSSYKADRR
jgi:hypothetical protein